MSEIELVCGAGDRIAATIMSTVREAVMSETIRWAVHFSRVTAKSTLLPGDEESKAKAAVQILETCMVQTAISRVPSCLRNVYTAATTSQTLSYISSSVSGSIRYV